MKRDPSLNGDLRRRRDELFAGRHVWQQFQRRRRVNAGDALEAGRLRRQAGLVLADKPEPRRFVTALDDALDVDAPGVAVGVREPQLRQGDAHLDGPSARADLHRRRPHGVPRRVEKIVVVDERVALDAGRRHAELRAGEARVVRVGITISASASTATSRRESTRARSRRGCDLASRQPRTRRGRRRRSGSGCLRSRASLRRDRAGATRRPARPRPTRDRRPPVDQRRRNGAHSVHHANRVRLGHRGRRTEGRAGEGGGDHERGSRRERHPAQSIAGAPDPRGCRRPRGIPGRRATGGSTATTRRMRRLRAPGSRGRTP